MAEDQPRPAPQLFPVGSVPIPWRVRLRLARAEATRGAEGSQPRRVLLRDASGVLIAAALVLFVAGQLSAAPPDGPAADAQVREVGAAGVSLPVGTLNLWTATPMPSTAPGQKQRVVITKSTPPPWCADPQCSHFVTPSPSPSPSPKPTATPTPAPSASATPSSSRPPATPTP